MEQARTLRLHRDDNVLVAARPVSAGQAIDGSGLGARHDIPAGHKVATAAIAVGAPVRKFSQIIGFASTDIAPGEHIHVHNCVMGDFER